LYFIKYEGGSQKCLSSFIQVTEITEISNAVVYTTKDYSIHGHAIWDLCRGSTAAAVGNVTYLLAG